MLFLLINMYVYAYNVYCVCAFQCLFFLQILYICLYIAAAAASAAASPAVASAAAAVVVAAAAAAGHQLNVFGVAFLGLEAVATGAMDSEVRLSSINRGVCLYVHLAAAAAAAAAVNAAAAAVNAAVAANAAVAVKVAVAAGGADVATAAAPQLLLLFVLVLLPLLLLLLHAAAACCCCCCSKRYRCHSNQVKHIAALPHDSRNLWWSASDDGTQNPKP